MKQSISYFTYALVILVFLMVGCKSEARMDEDDHTERKAEEVLRNVKPGDFEIITIDECQYLIYTESFGSTNRGFGFMAHKGNCNNPIHIYHQRDSL